MRRPAHRCVIPAERQSHCHLLHHLQAKTLILTGMAANICVLFTANDAYMRDFRLIVPCDCVASNTEDENRHALQQMHKVLKADIRESTHVEF